MRFVLWVLALAASLSGCAVPGRNTTAEAIRHEMDAAAQESAKPSKPEEVNNALLPPLAALIPKVESLPPEPRFDLTVNDTPASQVFMAIVSGTRYSMLTPPGISGNISLNLKDVTVFEALDAIREMYGYEYKVDGARIFIQPATLQTRIFLVNYLTGQRAGASSLRVSSSSLTGNVAPTVAGQPAVAPAPAAATTADGSKVSMTSSTDFWDELSKSLTAIVGNDKGRSVVISPMSGVIVVRAMPDELKNVAAYLKASQISVERQVILEAKIVEVQLNDSFQSGVNWGAFKNSPNSRTSLGQVAPGGTLAPGVAGTGGLTPGALANGANLGAVMPGTNLVGGANGAGSVFGLAFQTSSFAALLNFLETQGNVHVLSSPRIATLNNQKAVLKVGTDEFFVTNVSSTTTTGTATTTTPTVTLQPFFSGIALDVMPRIDENNDVILHVHPSVSLVSTVKKTVDLGTTAGVANVLNLPLASSSISETDSIVRAHDGQIVAIGGLMQQRTQDDRSGLPQMPKTLFGQTSVSTAKHELVILLKPTVVDSSRDWSEDITRSRDRMNGMTNSSGAKP